ncbi:MAG TPA: hypothetical protein VG992_00550 [Candidatus Saccharimonadales bacterium]|nr:hypothetical protein [Candidatus Saccharimonadales bacterium]
MDAVDITMLIYFSCVGAILWFGASWHVAHQIQTGAMQHRLVQQSRSVRATLIVLSPFTQLVRGIGLALQLISGVAILAMKTMYGAIVGPATPSAQPSAPIEHGGVL